MAQGKAITDQQAELIKATFAETGSLTASSRAAGCSLSTAKKYADSRDAFEALRSEKRIDIIERITELQLKLIETMMESGHLAKASFQELSVGFGIAIDKKLLLTGQATQRTETITDPSVRLTAEEMELAAKVREKHAAAVTR